MNYCPNCGHKIDEKQELCPNCDHRLTSVAFATNIETNITLFKISREKYNNFTSIIKNNLYIMFSSIALIMIVTSISPEIGWAAFLLGIIYLYYISNKKNSDEFVINNTIREKILNFDKAQVKNLQKKVTEESTKVIKQSVEKIQINAQHIYDQALTNNPSETEHPNNLSKEQKQSELEAASPETRIEDKELTNNQPLTIVEVVLPLIASAFFLTAFFLLPLMITKVDILGYGISSDSESLANIIKLALQISNDTDIYYSNLILISFPIIYVLLSFIKNKSAGVCQMLIAIGCTVTLYSILEAIFELVFNFTILEFSASYGFGFGAYWLLIGIVMMYIGALVKIIKR